MTQKKDTDSPNDLRVVDFQKAKDHAEKEENKLPDFFIEKIETLLEKAKEGKIQNLVLHFDFGDEVENDDGEIVGGTLLWNRSRNAAELIGIVEIIKTLALDAALDPDLE